MAIYQVLPNELRAIAETSFWEEGMKERQDLQRLLREQITVIDESLMVIAEEFGEWVDANRRIDLLCLDREGNLVVVELKRDETGAHMELQALRYAAMVSDMTFEQLVAAHARYCNKADPDAANAKSAILEFLGWDSGDEDNFSAYPRVILVSGDFSKELTTTVLWLIGRGIDIRCVRLKPYRMVEGYLLLDVEQVIPLPEAADYQTQIGVKSQAERQGLTERHALRLKFWADLLVYARTRCAVHADRSPSNSPDIRGSIAHSGCCLSYVARKTDSQVELWISFGAGKRDRSKAAFRALQAQQAAIHTDFGGELDWQELPEGDGSRIRFVVQGGYRSPPGEWPTVIASLVDAMVRLDRAMRPRVAALVV